MNTIKITVYLSDENIFEYFYYGNVWQHEALDMFRKAFPKYKDNIIIAEDIKLDDEIIIKYAEDDKICIIL